MKMNNDLTQTVVNLKFQIDKLITENKELKEELQRLSSDKSLYSNSCYLFNSHTNTFIHA